MSLHEYQTAVKLRDQDVPFYALIMAAMLRADDENLRLLRQAWPEIHAQLEQRYDSNGGLLDDEREESEAWKKARAEGKLSKPIESLDELDEV